MNNLSLALVGRVATHGLLPRLAREGSCEFSISWAIISITVSGILHNHTLCSLVAPRLTVMKSQSASRGIFGDTKVGSLKSKLSERSANPIPT